MDKNQALREIDKLMKPRASTHNNIYNKTDNPFLRKLDDIVKALASYDVMCENIQKLRKEIRDTRQEIFVLKDIVLRELSEYWLSFNKQLKLIEEKYHKIIRQNGLLIKKLIVDKKHSR